MPSLGVEVRSRIAPPSRGVPTATDALFVPTFLPTTGPTDTVTEVRSILDYEATYGDRTGANVPIYDALDAYFREGGRRAFVARGAADIDDALALFSKNLGPGQVVYWDAVPSSATFSDFYSWAQTTNRFFLADVEVDSTTTDMNAISDYIPTTGPDFGMLVAPWLEIPGPSGVVGASSRQVPASAVVAALIARSDSMGNPNRAAAGRDFPLQYATGFTVEISDTDRQNLLDDGVNTFADIYGVLELYGFQTKVEQTQDNPYWQANCSRTRMWLTGEANAIGENYMFKTIDGKGKIQQRLKSDLEAICLDLYGMDGLFGETPQEAFAVNVAASINTTETIAQGELHAAVEVRLSLHAKYVVIELITVPVNGNVSPA